tara:strand:+ start:97 stop:480 length:384 start_codon:yes stop_codon:yes gene_type:complete
METKEQLQAKIDTLQSQISNLTSELQREQKVLQDVNKPKLTQDVHDALHDAINEAVDCAIQDIDLYNCDFEFEMNGSEVSVYRMDYNNSGETGEEVADKVMRMFGVIEEELPLNSGDIAVEQAAVHA